MKKKIAAKAKLEKPKPIRIQVDPRQLEACLTIPEISYEVVATCTEMEVFRGNIIPLPRVLPYYLKHMELMVFLVVMEESLQKGGCRLTGQEIAKMLKTTRVSVSQAMHSLRKQGLILEGDFMGGGDDRRLKLRKVNYAAVQHLHELVQGHEDGVFARIRRATRKKDIQSLTEEDLMAAYDNVVLPPGHDPREEEEYN